MLRLLKEGIVIIFLAFLLYLAYNIGSAVKEKDIKHQCDSYNAINFYGYGSTSLERYKCTKMEK